jgi:hypothetical protein
MSTTPAPLTPAELDALRLALQRDQIAASNRNAAAVEQQTLALIAAREAADKQAAASRELMATILARPVGISEALFTSTLQLIVTALTGAKPAA